jgi:hypothetical protein
MSQTKQKKSELIPYIITNYEDMRDDMVIDQLFKFHKLNKKKVSEKMMDYIITETKRAINFYERVEQHNAHGNIRVAQNKPMLELINPWISTQKAKTQNSIQYIITRVRQLEHLLIITRKQQKEPAGHAFGNAALCGPPTLRNGKASEPFRRSSDHGSQILNRGLSLFRIMVPPPSQVFL